MTKLNNTPKMIASLPFFFCFGITLSFAMLVSLFHIRINTDIEHLDTIISITALLASLLLPVISTAVLAIFYEKKLQKNKICVNKLLFYCFLMLSCIAFFAAAKNIFFSSFEYDKALQNLSDTDDIPNKNSLFLAWASFFLPPLALFSAFKSKTFFYFLFLLIAVSALTLIHPIS
jgi:hypothetical protein